LYIIKFEQYTHSVQILPNVVVLCLDHATLPHKKGRVAMCALEMKCAGKLLGTRVIRIRKELMMVPKGFSGQLNLAIRCQELTQTIMHPPLL